MSYGSTYVQFESANGRISQKFASRSVRREQFAQERAKAVNYEKQFDVNLTRVDAIPNKASVKESMLAYSRKMKSLQENRFSENGGKGDPLFVRAKHIPKYPSKPQKKRRPMSFDELLGRDRDVPDDRPQGAKRRPSSEKLKPVKDKTTDNEFHLPMLSERLKKTKNVQVSLVSASDLYDIVDFTLRTKGTRNDSLKMLRLEQEVRDYNSKQHSKRRETDTAYDVVMPNNTYSDFERQPDQGSKISADIDRNKNENKPKSLVVAEEMYKELFGTSIDEPDPPSVKLPPINNDPFKRRPSRAKRMKLVDSGLGDIPEDNIVQIANSVRNKQHGRARVPSPHARQSPNMHPETSTHLGIIDEKSEANQTDIVNVDGDDVTDGLHAPDKNYSLNAVSYGYSSADSSSVLPNQGLFSPLIDTKSSKKVLKDDGDVRIEVTQCPPKHETVSAKLKAQKRFKKLIFLRDAPR